MKRDEPRDRTDSPLRDRLRVYGPALVITVIGFIVAYQFVEPAPPDHLTIGTASADGAYYRHAKRYREVLAREGITLEIRETSGSLENLDLLTKSEGVDAAFVQGGTAPTSLRENLSALGSLYFEPLWIFTRPQIEAERVVDLRARRVAVGPEGSGTRAVALRLLEDCAAAETPTQLVALGGSEAAEALRSGETDAAFFVAPEDSELIRSLLADYRVRLMSMERADAFARRHRFLSSVILPEGVVDPARNVPSSEVTLLAPAATLVIRNDLHPALAVLLLEAAHEAHSEAGLLASAGEFPTPRFLNLPLSPEAKRFYRSGPPFLQRYLPFWAATLIDRLKVFLVPLLTLMIPLFKIVPPTYRWRVRARIYRWYRTLKELEVRLYAGPEAEELVSCRAELEHLDREVAQVTVPLSYAEELYHLRLHIALVREEAAKIAPE